MAVTVIITYLICNCIYINLIFKFLDKYFKKDRVSKFGKLAAYSLYYLALTSFNLINFGSVYNMIINLCFCFLMGLLYHTTNLKRILAAIFIYIILLPCDIFTFYSILLLFKASYEEFLNDSFFVVVGMIFCTIFQCITVKLIGPLLRSQDAEVPPSYWLAVFLIPSGSIYIICSIYIQYINDGIHDLIFTLITIMILYAINILVFYLYDKLIKDEEIKYENLMLHQQKEAYENQALLIRGFQDSLHDEKHDMKGHLSTVKRMLEEKQTDEAVNYIDKLVGKTEDIVSSINSGDVVIDAMVNSKLYLANLQNTLFHVDIQLSQPLEIDPVDLTVILCNLFDNALEACEKLHNAQREIWVKIKYQHKVLSIAVANTYNPEKIDIRDGKVHTTKEDKTRHGIGLKRICQTVEKYNGMFSYDVSKKDGRALFTVEILLYLHKDSPDKPEK